MIQIMGLFDKYALLTQNSRFTYNFSLSQPELFREAASMFLLESERLPGELLASATTQELSRGQYLYRQGDAARAVYVVVSGRAQLCTTSTDGKQINLYVAGAGECVDEAALFADRYGSDVLAETCSRVRAFPIKALREVVFKHPDLALEFMKLQAKRWNALRISLELRSLRSARERILQYLVISGPPQLGPFAVDRPLKNIASDLGLTHESFYRTLSILVEDGVISRTGNVVQLNELRPLPAANGRV